MGFLTKIFGNANGRELERIDGIRVAVNAQEEAVAALKDGDLAVRMSEFRALVAAGKQTPNGLLPEVFALVREAAKRTVGMRHFDAQILGGIVLHQGKIAEMKTGEGKTLVATLPLALNALGGKGCYLVTVNDYLARRDAGWMGPVYHALGLTVGIIIHEQAFRYDPSFTQNGMDDDRLAHLRPVPRQEAYAADITYGTNNEFGFDYLRDNMAPDQRYEAQRLRHYAIVDEVDSILVDEARTPLIISAPAEESTEQHYRFAELVRRLELGTDYNVDEKLKTAALTEVGMEKIEGWLGMGNIYTAGGIELVHHIESALRAHALFQRDREYVVKDGEVIIVDEFTGRLMLGRRYSEGLHQAIEAKEGVTIRKESQTLATVTFQNYFRLFDKLAGMTGTAMTEAEEFSKIYHLEVVAIPTHKPMIRKDLADRVYKNEKGKFLAVVQDIRRRHELGQPVLVGTISIGKNEILSELLTREGIPHSVLNAKHHEKEASIIAQAGRKGAVTLATNIAGRGVDIILGGNPTDAQDAALVKETGGLHVLGTERHEARRIDNQLRGRSGRQGDPGSSQFYVSMEDDLLRIFGSERMQSLMDRLGVPDDMPIENRMVSRSIEGAQHKVEGHNFDIRKHLVEYDDVMNRHREVLYKLRRDILTLPPDKLDAKLFEWVEQEIGFVVSHHTARENERAWNLDEIYEVIDTIFPLPIEARIALDDLRAKAGDLPADAQAREAIIAYLIEQANIAHESFAKGIGTADRLAAVERGVCLRIIDTLWIEHLDMMEYLRTGIGLRGYGQRDPLVEYKREAYDLFTQLINNIHAQYVYTIFKIRMQPEAEQTQPHRSLVESHPSVTLGKVIEHQKSSTELEKPAPVRTRAAGGRKVGRNDPCPCGSGLKYKKCGLIGAPEHQTSHT